MGYQTGGQVQVWQVGQKKDDRPDCTIRAMIEAQNKGMAKPIWPGLIEGPVRIDVPLNAPWKDGQDYIYWTN